MADATAADGVPELPISAATDDVVYFEKATLFPGRGETTLGDTMARHRMAGGFAPVWITTSVKSYRLRDVVVDAESMLLFKDGAVIPETSYFVPERLRVNARVRDEPPIRCDDSEDIIIGYNLVHWDYQHWLTQCIPAIDWALRMRRRDRVRLLLPRLEPAQEDLLALLGHQTIPRLVPEFGAQYLLPHAEYSQFLNGSAAFRVCLSALATCRHILDAVPSRESPYSIIVVPCIRPYHGTVVNEADVMDFLRARGAYILDRDNLTTADRINLFRYADVVIGVIGEGLADIVFCKPGTLVWELMPTHHHNACYNFLAQAAELDYWADIFETSGQDGSRDWKVDLELVADRFNAIEQRLRRNVHQPRATAPPITVTPGRWLSLTSQQTKPLDEIMLEFESLGDNCEFGLVQRIAGIEPLGLLRFTGIGLRQLIAGLEADFAGIGAHESVKVTLAGEPDHREFLVTERTYGLIYHTFILEGQIEADELHERETRRLPFLRRKLMEELKDGDRIWVRKSNRPVAYDEIRRLLNILRRHGPNILLWVLEADAEHPAGTVERVEGDLIKGYVERFAPYDDANNIRPYSWFEVCLRTYEMCRVNLPADTRPGELRLQDLPTPVALPLSGWTR